LAKHFIQKICKSYEMDRPYVTDEALNWIKNQDYSGNIRQLRNIVERTVLLSQKKDLGIRDFQDNMIIKKRSIHKVTLPNIGEMTLDELESSMIQKTLAYHNHSISKAARSLGLTRSSLYRRMEKYGIG